MRCNCSVIDDSSLLLSSSPTQTAAKCGTASLMSAHAPVTSPSAPSPLVCACCCRECGVCFTSFEHQLDSSLSKCHFACSPALLHLLHLLRCRRTLRSKSTNSTARWRRCSAWALMAEKNPTLTHSRCPLFPPLPRLSAAAPLAQTLLLSRHQLKFLLRNWLVLGA